MLKIQSLLRSFTKTIKSISKKCYSNCFVITTGFAVVAVISLNSNSFDGAGKNKVIAKQLSGNQLKAKEEVDLEAKILKALEEQSQEEQLMGEIISQNSKLQAKNVEVIVRTNNTNIVTQSNQKIENKIDKVIKYSQADYEALLKIVEAEATGEDLKGKILVANVVLNRVKSEEFPNTIQEVIFQKVNGQVQFSPIADGRFNKVKVSEETKLAVERALEGEDYSKGALFFVARSYAKKSNLNWFDRNLTKLFVHGLHEFYTY